MPRGLTEKNARAHSYYSGFRAVRRRYGELCMVSPATSRHAGSFPCMPCICRVIDGCVNFIGARYRYAPGLSSSTRRLRYARSRLMRDASERVIFLGAINLPPILIRDSESATVNGRTIERRYPTRIFFCQPRNVSSDPRESVTIICYENPLIKEERIQRGRCILLFCSISCD